MASIEKKVVLMGPQEDLAEVRCIFGAGSVAQFAAGVQVTSPPGFNVIVRWDSSQNFNDLTIRCGRDFLVPRALYRIGTPLTMFTIFTFDGESPVNLTLTGTPAGFTDFNIFFGRLKIPDPGACV
jgi:hypothetical protein